MREELRAESVAFVRAFDQTRHIGHDEGSVIAQLHDAEIRRQRRERVVGDLRPRRRDARDECALARVREADESDVREELEPQAQLPGLAWRAGFGSTWRAIGGRRKCRVATATASAPRDKHALANF